MEETISFTGPHRDLSRAETNYIRDVVRQQQADVYASGAAFGVDTATILAASELCNWRDLLLCIPKGHWYNTALPALLTTPHYRPRIELISGGYMARNDRLVVVATKLIAFPDTPVPQLRSGTWSTIRRAIRAGVPVEYYYLCDA